MAWTLSWLYLFNIMQLIKGDSSVLTSESARSPLIAKKFRYNFNDYMLGRLYRPNMSAPTLEVGTGYPDYLPAITLLNGLLRVASDRYRKDAWTLHQYAKPQGDPRLTQSVANFFSPLMKRTLEPNNVLITAGAQQALEASVRAYLDPGDEAIIFEPQYFMYEPVIRLSNGVPVYVPLHPKAGTTGRLSQDWTFDRKTLARSITNRTKLILVNTPLNPYGKMFTLDELTFIGGLAIKHNLVVVSDEVKQFLIYDQQEHIRMATLPGMWERTLTVTSGGKLFASTGWRIGWLIGPAELLWAPAVAAMTETYNAAKPLQFATAMALDAERPHFYANSDKSFVRFLRDRCRRNRDKLVSAFEAIGADPIVPAGGYSLIVNFTSLSDLIDLSEFSDPRPGFKMGDWLMKNALIDAMPLTPYFSTGRYSEIEYMLRFILIKSEPLVDQLSANVLALFNRLKQDKAKRIKAEIRARFARTNVAPV